MLAIATAIRIAVAVAYWPATYFSDTWAYVEMAYGKGFIGVDPSRPSGYPLVMRILSLAGRELAVITIAQHLAGLVVAVLVYVLLLHLEVRRGVAVAATALVALNAHAIALEQEVMTEAFFTLTLFAGAYLAIRATGWRTLVLSGLLIAATVTMRNQALFAVPVWAAYLVWRTGIRRAIAPAVALVLPLLAYCAFHQNATGRFGFITGEGWFMYGRVTLLGGCGDADVPPETRPLCAGIDPDPRREDDPLSYHVFIETAPAPRLFNSDLYEIDPARRDQVNSLLQRFALAVVRERPLAYARSVATEFALFFTSGVRSPGSNDDSITLPDRDWVGYVNENVRQAHFPDYQLRVRAPADVLLAYQRVVHTPRWLMALFALAGILVLLAHVALRRLVLRHTREVFLLVGLPLAMVLGAAAFAGFALRLMVPVVPLLVCGGVVAIAQLLEAWSVRRRSAASPAR